MMEYTLVVILVGLFLVVLDRVLSTRILSLRNQAWRNTILVFIFFQGIFDNAFTYAGIWRFNPEETVGIFIPFIPIENLVYGVELMTFVLILYTFFQRILIQRKA